MPTISTNDDRWRVSVENTPKAADSMVDSRGIIKEEQGEPEIIASLTPEVTFSNSESEPEVNTSDISETEVISNETAGPDVRPDVTPEVNATNSSGPEVISNDSVGPEVNSNGSAESKVISKDSVESEETSNNSPELEENTADSPGTQNELFEPEVNSNNSPEPEELSNYDEPDVTSDYSPSDSDVNSDDSSWEPKSSKSNKSPKKTSNRGVRKGSKTTKASSFKKWRGPAVSEERRRFECYLCDAFLTSHNGLKLHLNSIHKLGVTIKNAKSEMIRKWNEQLGAPPIEIDKEIDLQKKEESSLQQPTDKSSDNSENTASKPAPFPCPICDKSFTLSIALTKHIHLNHEAASIPKTPSALMCRMCNMRFTSIQSKVLHETSRHLRINAKLQCTTCSFQCSDAESLKTHISTKHFGQHEEQKHVSLDVSEARSSTVVVVKPIVYSVELPPSTEHAKVGYNNQTETTEEHNNNEGEAMRIRDTKINRVTKPHRTSAQKRTETYTKTTKACDINTEPKYSPSTANAQKVPISSTSTANKVPNSSTSNTNKIPISSIIADSEDDMDTPMDNEDDMVLYASTNTKSTQGVNTESTQGVNTESTQDVNIESTQGVKTTSGRLTAKITQNILARQRRKTSPRRDIVRSCGTKNKAFSGIIDHQGITIKNCVVLLKDVMASQKTKQSLPAASQTTQPITNESKKKTFKPRETNQSITNKSNKKKNRPRHISPPITNDSNATIPNSNDSPTRKTLRERSKATTYIDPPSPSSSRSPSPYASSASSYAPSNGSRAS